MAVETDFNMDTMLKFSEILLNPGMRKIPLTDWLDNYNRAKDGHLKYILTKCLPYIDSLDVQLILDRIHTDCPYEKCDLLIQLINLQNNDHKLILDWLLEQVEKPINNCEHHCVCSLIKLGIKLIEKETQWPINWSISLLKIVNNRRCALDCYLDFILALIETKLHDHDYLEELFSRMVSKLDPKDYLSIKGTIDDQPEIIFNGISDCMLLRKMLLPRLTILSQLGLEKFPKQLVNEQLQSMEDLISNSIHWSYHPFIDLFIEEDSMVLKCLNSLVQLQVHTNESAVHHLIKSFLDSINHDVDCLIEWLSSDSDIADTTLRILLTYLKLTSINSQCSPMVKIFFNQLLKRIDGLWRKQLFPYNPSALLKYQDKF